MKPNLISDGLKANAVWTTMTSNTPLSVAGPGWDASLRLVLAMQSHSSR